MLDINLYFHDFFFNFRQYLRGRDDTVRCVITNLTEEGPSDLAEELVRGSEAPVDEHTVTECEIENWEKWNPDPVDADPCMYIDTILIMLFYVKRTF